MTPRRIPAVRGHGGHRPRAVPRGDGALSGLPRAQRPTEWASLESVIRGVARRGRSRAAQAMAVPGLASGTCATSSWWATPTSSPCATWCSTASRRRRMTTPSIRRTSTMPTSRAATGASTTGTPARTASTPRYFGEVRGEKNKSDPINFDRIDYRPELAVGRWPVDTEAEVRWWPRRPWPRTGRSRRIKGTDCGGRDWSDVPGWVDARGQMDRWAAELPRGLEGGEALRRPAEVRLRPTSIMSRCS